MWKEKEEDRTGDTLCGSEIVKEFVCTCEKSGVDEVTMMHGWIIRYLYENREQDIFQKDIEQRFAVGRSTVTNLLQLMERRDS